jgi:serine/arginine repetitive matrix protein 2
MLIAIAGIQHAHLQQQIESQKAAEELAAQKRAMLQTADSFRGVHLDPNAHHWDEVSCIIH